MSTPNDYPRDVPPDVLAAADKACCRIVSGDRTGPTPRGRAECGGNPGLSLRDDVHEQGN
ncbi:MULTISPECIES: hypothetical protein [unclassified Micromonospora]|uniref:hypothetical protein n=1 Tax=unclassified Micromonospora TaxID=2617518 RepID=UPI0033A83A1E